MIHEEILLRIANASFRLPNEMFPRPNVFDYIINSNLVLTAQWYSDRLTVLGSQVQILRQDLIHILSGRLDKSTRRSHY